MFKRPMFSELARRLQEPRRFIQVLAGARQTGKTTLARQALDELKGEGHYATADEPTLKGRGWIEQQWEVGASWPAERTAGAVLVLDEVQKIPGWSETVKRLWDEDTAAKRPLHVVVLGSAPLLVQSGLSESLAGRFEVIRVPHWSFSEMTEAFGWSLDQYIYYGGYPGSAPLIGNPQTMANVHHRLPRRNHAFARHLADATSGQAGPAPETYSNWGASTPDRCFHTRSFWASCRTPATQPRWRTIWSCSRGGPAGGTAQICRAKGAPPRLQPKVPGA